MVHTFLSPSLSRHCAVEMKLELSGSRPRRFTKTILSGIVVSRDIGFTLMA